MRPSPVDKKRPSELHATGGGAAILVCTDPAAVAITTRPEPAVAIRPLPAARSTGSTQRLGIADDSVGARWRRCETGGDDPGDGRADGLGSGLGAGVRRGAATRRAPPPPCQI